MLGTKTIIALAASALLLGACSTKDYTKITTKIAAYEVVAEREKAALAEAKDNAVRIHAARALVSLAEKELVLARRIDAKSNPAYRAGSLTLDQANQDRDKRIVELDALLKERQTALAKITAK